jgi:hypothetical protein
VVREASANRVSLDVSKRGDGVMFVHDHGIEAVLPKVARPLVSKIRGPGVLLMQLAEESGQTVGLARYDYRVDVVRHQAIGKYLNVMRLEELLCQYQIVFVVTRIKKSLLSPDATLSDMVRVSRHHQPAKSGHATTSLLIKNRNHYGDLAAAMLPENFGGLAEIR